MNLYTKIWLKLAPKGYVGVEEERIFYLKHMNEEAHRAVRKNESLLSDIERLKDTIKNLRSTYRNLDVLDYMYRNGYNAYPGKKEGE